MEVRGRFKYNELRNQYRTFHTIKIEDPRVCIFAGVMTFARYTSIVEWLEECDEYYLSSLICSQFSKS